MGHLKIFSKTTKPQKLRFTWNFLTQCRFKFVHIMVPGGWMGPQKGKPYLHVFILKKKFSRTIRPISIKFGTIYPWVKRITNCSNKGSGPLQSGDNHKSA
jgi:hypothetical protein